MPYASASNARSICFAPQGLPPHAQHIYRAAFNYPFTEYA